jgi:small conductance mechanosensitive channel
VQEIADLRIAVKQEAEAAEKAAEDVDEAEEKKEEENEEDADSAATQVDAEAAAANAKAAETRKQQLADSLPGLQEEKTHLVQRMMVVLDELEAKGGDVESYRMYIISLAGVAVEVTDASTFWTVTTGWLKSEQGGKRWAWNIVKFLVILLAFYFGASIIANLVRHAASRVRGASQLLVNFTGKFVKQILMILGLIVALAALEVNITPLLAAVGAAGFVIGFALQDTLSNFASGLLILAYRPFDVGDVVEAADISGIVDSVSLFSTHIRTFDNKLMIVPNNDIWGGTITNATASDTRRVDMMFGIGYDDDIGKARAILERIVTSHEKVLSDPAPVIQLHELADSSVNFVCRPWTKTADYWSVYWDVTRMVKEEFDRQGISIPFPQRDIHVYHEAAQSVS